MKIFKNIWLMFVGALCAVYLLNPGAGFLELIPDNIPLIGNLDEAAAVALLLAILRHFGWDFTQIFSRKKIKDVTPKK